MISSGASSTGSTLLLRRSSSQVCRVLPRLAAFLNLGLSFLLTHSFCSSMVRLMTAGNQLDARPTADQTERPVRSSNMHGNQSARLESLLGRLQNVRPNWKGFKAL